MSYRYIKYLSFLYLKVGNIISNGLKMAYESRNFFTAAIKMCLEVRIQLKIVSPILSRIK